MHRVPSSRRHTHRGKAFTLLSLDDGLIYVPIRSANQEGAGSGRVHHGAVPGHRLDVNALTWMGKGLRTRTCAAQANTGEGEGSEFETGANRHAENNKCEKQCGTTHRHVHARTCPCTRTHAPQSNPLQCPTTQRCPVVVPSCLECLVQLPPCGVCRRSLTHRHHLQ
jgi:hypothetical protein